MNEVLSFYIKLFSTFTFRALSQPPRFGSARCITGEKSLNIKQNLEKNTENDLLVFSEMGPHSRGMGGKVRLTWNHFEILRLLFPAAFNGFNFLEHHYTTTARHISGNVKQVVCVNLVFNWLLSPPPFIYLKNVLQSRHPKHTNISIYELMWQILHWVSLSKFGR